MIHCYASLEEFRIGQRVRKLFTSEISRSSADLPLRLAILCRVSTLQGTLRSPSHVHGRRTLSATVQLVLVVAMGRASVKHATGRSGMKFYNIPDIFNFIE
jgi:hypothetical protein